MTGKHVLSVCVFCFICATHSPCSSHADVSDGNSRHVYSPKSPYYDDSSNRNNRPLSIVTETRHKLRKRDSITQLKTNKLDKANSDGDLEKNSTIDNHRKLDVDQMQTNKNLRKIFHMFGDGESITMDGLEKLMEKLRLKSADLSDLVREDDFDDSKDVVHLPEIEQAPVCLNKSDLLNSHSTISHSEFYTSLCPDLLYGVLVGICPNNRRPSGASGRFEHNITLPQAQISDEGASVENVTGGGGDNRTLVWVYSMCAVCVISFCGILGLAVIPIMQKTYYEPLLQFLVALAVGTLAGDALLHLLPHAMSSHSHSHGENNESVEHNANTWKGLVAMGGLVLFFVMERVIIFASKWRKSQQLKNKQPTRLKVIDPDKSTSVTSAADKQCKHKYSSFPYCYDEIKMIDHTSLDPSSGIAKQQNRLAAGSDDIIIHSDSQHRCNSFPHIGHDHHSHSHPNIADCATPKHKHQHAKARSNGRLSAMDVDGCGGDDSTVHSARIRTAGNTAGRCEQRESLMRKDGGDYEGIQMPIDEMDIDRMNDVLHRIITEKTGLRDEDDDAYRDVLKTIDQTPDDFEDNKIFRYLNRCDSQDFPHQSEHLVQPYHPHPIHNHHSHQHHPDNTLSIARPPMNKTPSADSGEYTVILREHRNEHHGHSHAHGHVHAAPSDLSAVVWMVIMGDGLHNFTDGMAIGAAFSSSITGGLSTALAVFFHEVPHELGDFAMLLKAGMSMRQALFYNLLSSVLCLAGNAFGVWLGKTEEATSWVFAAAAGMFIYIALVDMIPELSAAHEGDGGTLLQCVLHTGGLLLGVGIMLLIACYELELMRIFNDV